MDTTGMQKKVMELFHNSKWKGTIKHGSIEEMKEIATQLFIEFPKAFKAHGEIVRFVYHTLKHSKE